MRIGCSTEADAATIYRCKGFFTAQSSSSHGSFFSSGNSSDSFDLPFKKLTGAKKVKREYSALVEDLDARGEFQQVVSGYIGQLREEEATSEQSPAQRYDKIKKILNQAAEETLPEAPVKVSG